VAQSIETVQTQSMPSLDNDSDSDSDSDSESEDEPSGPTPEHVKAIQEVPNVAEKITIKCSV